MCQHLAGLLVLGDIGTRSRSDEPFVLVSSSQPVSKVWPPLVG